jgi:glycosyltransferase involved in cell wall biosynthesis
MAKPRLYVVVPVFNEAGNIPRLLGAFGDIQRQLGGEYSVRFLMIDDGSTDGTSDAATRLATGFDFRVVRHEKNQGPGRAFASAFSILAGQLDPNDTVVTIEGDNTSRLELLQRMLIRSREGFDVVLASPYLYGGGIANTSAYRVFLSHMANLFLKEGLGLHGIVTMSSFFRLYRGSALMRLQEVYGPEVVERAGFESMIEMLLKMVYLDFAISEIAMRLDTSQRVGKSKMKVARTALGYLTLWREKPRWRRVALAAHKPTELAPPATPSRAASRGG